MTVCMKADGRSHTYREMAAFLGKVLRRER